MGRLPCCDENGLKKGPWTPEEDQKLIQHIEKHGHGSWRALPRQAGLNRCGKSCRLRWTNYLRPDIKRGNFSSEEEQAILNLHSILGNKWSAIARHLPGRTDNEIKNFWNTHLKKKLIQMGFDPMTHRPRTDIFSSIPHLLALANLKDLMDFQNAWDDHNSAGIIHQQSETVQMAKLHCLQYLLQSSTVTNCPTVDSMISTSPLGILEGFPMPDLTTQFTNYQEQQLLQVEKTSNIEMDHVPDNGGRKTEGHDQNTGQFKSTVLSPLADHLSINGTSSSYDDVCGTPNNSLWNEILLDHDFTY